MTNTIHEEKYRGYTIQICPDEEPLNPREDFDHLCTMICFHRRYNLGDTHSWDVDEFEEFIKKNDDKLFWLPLYLYDHSGITMNTTGYSCPWDSGQVGAIYVTKEKIREAYKCKRISASRAKFVYEIMKAEVKEYDDYLTGAVYGYYIEETGESCWGYFGDYEYCLKEAREMVDYTIRHEIKKHCQKLKQWIINSVPEIFRNECPVKR